MTEVSPEGYNVLAILETPQLEEPKSELGQTEVSDPMDDSSDEDEYEYKSRDYQEKSFEDKICRVLDLEEESMYERQKKIKNGIIDIFIYGQPPTIVEVKRVGTPFYLIQAIAQLKFYEMCFPRKCKLFIAVPGGIPQKYLPILQEFGVSELMVDGNIAMWKSRGLL